MNEAQKWERGVRISRALAGFAKGQYPDGTPIFLSDVGARITPEAQKFSRDIRLGEQQTRQKLWAGRGYKG